MPAIARANGVDSVFSRTGTGRRCGSPARTVTGVGTCQVYAGGTVVVRQGDQVGLHPAGGCSPDTSPLTSFSSTVFIGGKGVGRIGDFYTSDNVITSGYSTVFVGG